MSDNLLIMDDSKLSSKTNKLMWVIILKCKIDIT